MSIVAKVLVMDYHYVHSNIVEVRIICKIVEFLLVIRYGTAAIVRCFVVSKNIDWSLGKWHQVMIRQNNLTENRSRGERTQQLISSGWLQPGGARCCGARRWVVKGVLKWGEVGC